MSEPKLRSPKEEAVADRLLLGMLEVMTSETPAGNPAYTDDEIRCGFAWLLFSVSEQLEARAGVVRAAINLRRLFGLKGDDTPERAARKIEKHCSKRLNPALTAQLRELMRDAVIGLGADAGAPGPAECLLATRPMLVAGDEAVPASAVRGSHTLRARRGEERQKS